MGIDVFMRWKGITKKQKDNQGLHLWNTEAGHLGYLREGYHGGPYVTKYLLAEAFKSDGGKTEIPVSVLRKRLPRAVKMAIRRNSKIYKEKTDAKSGVVLSFIRFVELAEKKEMRHGKPVTIIVSY